MKLRVPRSIQIVYLGLALLTSATAHSEPLEKGKERADDQPMSSLAMGYGFDLPLSFDFESILRKNSRTSDRDKHEVAINENKEIIFNSGPYINALRPEKYQIYNNLGHVQGVIHALHFSGSELRVGVSRGQKLFFEVYSVDFKNKTILIQSSREILKKRSDKIRNEEISAEIGSCCCFAGALACWPILPVFDCLRKSASHMDKAYHCNNEWIGLAFTPSGILYGTVLARPTRGSASQFTYHKSVFAASEAAESVFKLRVEDKYSQVSFTALSLHSGVAVISEMAPKKIYYWNNDPSSPIVEDFKDWSTTSILGPTGETSVLARIWQPTKEPHDFYGEINLDGTSTNPTPNPVQVPKAIFAFSPDLKFALIKKNRVYRFVEFNPKGEKR